MVRITYPQHIPVSHCKSIHWHAGLWDSCMNLPSGSPSEPWSPPGHAGRNQLDHPTHLQVFTPPLVHALCHVTLQFLSREAEHISLHPQHWAWLYDLLWPTESVMWAPALKVLVQWDLCPNAPLSPHEKDTSQRAQKAERHVHTWTSPGLGATPRCTPANLQMWLREGNACGCTPLSLGALC